MISHKHKCIFVHVPKVAGISIEQVFLDDLGLDFDNRDALILGINNNARIGPPRISHLIASEYVSLHYLSQDLYDSYYKFAFVRNPYGRVYSFYKYLAYDSLVSFETFVCEYLPLVLKDKSLYYFVQPMTNYIYSSSGQRMVDFVGKMENIDADFETVLAELRLTQYTLPHSNKSATINLRGKLRRCSRIIKKTPNVLLDFNFDKSKTQKKFSSEMRSIIFELYEKDFLNFGYQK